MNRLIILLSLVLAASLAQADNYFTIGENDTLRVTVGSDTVTVPVRAYFDGRVSRWTLTMTYPEGLVPLFATEGPDMAVYYLDSTGAACVTEAPIIQENTDPALERELEEYKYGTYTEAAKKIREAAGLDW